MIGAVLEVASRQARETATDKIFGLRFDSSKAFEKMSSVIWTSAVQQQI